MRLVLQYTAGFTYSAEITLPIEYESAEAMAVDFEEACKRPFITVTIGDGA